MIKKTYTLTIHLIKSSFVTESDIVIEGLDEKDIVGVGKLFHKSTFSPSPRWARLFSGYGIDEIFSPSSAASAILLVKVRERYFALTFGPAGRHLLQRGVTEERFGLVVTLNSVKEDSIRSIDTKTLESEGIQTRIQSSRPVASDSFGFDVEKDLVRSVAGESKDESFGKVLAGKDSLRASIKCNLEDVPSYLETFLDQFGKKDYIASFPWVDALHEISDPSKIDDLNSKLIIEINKESPEKMWLTVPEILDWADHGGFKYSQKKRDEQLLDDIHISSFKQYLRKDIVNLFDLENSSVYRFSQSNEYQQDHWRVYECVYFEYSIDSETYFLTGGKWYAVRNDLVQSVNTYYRSVPNETSGINFIDYNHSDENAYNNDLATANGALCLDKKEVQIEGRSKFEFCDVYTKQRQMIHVKRYSGSAVLSHLFNQGYVSANLLFDFESRKKINGILEQAFKISDLAKRPNDSSGEKYTVIFGVISKSSRDFDLPFFSKLTLMHVMKDLVNLGFGVSLVKIKNSKV